jgi:hypothetical protein
MQQKYNKTFKDFRQKKAALDGQSKSGGAKLTGCQFSFADIYYNLVHNNVNRLDMSIIANSA